MRSSYEIKPSNSQALLLVTVYFLASLAWWLALDTGLLLAAVELLILLLGLRDTRRLLNAPRARLRLLDPEPGIALTTGEQTHFFAKYKVYPSRWFAILKLIDQSKTRTLILNPDCFNTVTDYHNLRFELNAHEAHRAA